MKMIKKVAMSVTALVFIGSSIFAQSLADAKKAIDAEQYQKAKSMLKNLTVTQPTSDENWFYLGWVYVKQDYSDSAKTAFNKGVAINPKSALNYAGLGAVARLDKDQAGATSNFNQALTLAGKDTKPYMYVGKSYLLLVSPATVVTQANADAAIAVLEKGKTVNPKAKDAELMVTLGDAYVSQLKSSDAYKNYSDALGADPKSLTANVAEGVLWRLANNWESAANQFKAALAIDPNYGPAYREWAETDLRQAKNDIKVASDKVKEAVEYYRKYLSLTDMSIESQMRYADFLVNLGDYKALQETAAQLAKYANTNLRVYRYLGYAAYENKDYPAGLTALNKWISQAGEKRVLANDYMYLGRLQLASGDSAGIQSLKKAYQMDSTKADVFLEIANNARLKNQYLAAANAYQDYFDKSHKGGLLDHYYQAISYFYSFDANSAKSDSTLLTKADSAFSYVNKKAAAPVPDAVMYRAYIADLKDADRNNIKGLARPYYEQYISLVGSKATLVDKEKRYLASCYVYLATIYEYKDKDDAKTLEAYTKAKDYDPTNKQVIAYFARKPAAKAVK
ncbi:MAG: tetratricopeptide repeat protein [Bacteroidota bacterium]